MADVPVPSIATATPDGDDTVLGVKDGVVKRFTLDNVGAGINFSNINATTNMAFNTASVERMLLDSAGNLGLGVTPSVWASVAGTKALQVGTSGSYFLGCGSGWSANPFTYVGNNAFHDGTNWRYVSSAPTAQYVQYADQHIWNKAEGGIAGNNITFTQTMALDASGNLAMTGGGVVDAASFRDYSNTAYYLDPANTGTAMTVAGKVGIGTSSPAERLHVNGGSSSAFTQIVTEGASQGGIAIKATGSQYSFINATSLNDLRFSTNGSEKMQIDSSGNLIQTVNTTAATLTANNTLTFSIVDNTTLRISVRGSDGTTRTATIALT